MPCNLNTAGGSSLTDRVFLCYRKDYFGNPIIDLQLISKGKSLSNLTD